jgi:putative NADPH-quinone reductase
MKSTLIISGHPRLSQSTANRLIIETIINTPGVAICDIMTNYPDGKIDVEEEQSRLKAADLIVFQFPFIWYGMPSHMKAWMERVFSYGFAFGAGGDQLKNKKLLLSITLGGSSEAYSSQGQHLYTVETFLRPLELFVKYCGMQYLLPVYSYEMASTPGINQEIVEDKATLHARRVLRVIRSLNTNNPLPLLKQAG